MKLYTHHPAGAALMRKAHTEYYGMLSAAITQLVLFHISADF